MDSAANLPMAATKDNPEQWTADDAARDENRRIFRALAGLRRVGLKVNLGAETEPSVRTWGSLCTNFTDQQEARLHAVLRPFLHYTAPTHKTLVSTLQQALERVGVLKTAHEDIFEVVGAVKGDGARKIQVFYSNAEHTIEEYLLLS